MRRATFVKRFCLVLLCLSALFLGSIFSLRPVIAQEGGVAPGETVTTNPKSRTPQVTATVADNAPPSTPILIAPSNNSILTDNTPSFVWEASTDDLGINKYILIIDGNTYFDDIPTSSTVNANYTLTYNDITSQYTLTPTAPIPDGTHTWKIQVWDSNYNSADSVTWTFTIDSNAPSFVVTQIGTANVNISAQDVSTIPVTPLVLTANEPLIVATGEPSSVVQMTLIIPGDPSQNYTIPISSGGNWSVQLGILPRGVVMTLNFLITDPAGNISVLNGVQFMIEQEVIVIPPVTPVPSPTAPVTPEPGVTPEPPAPPITPGPSPLIVIPITPPRETIYNTVQEIIESLPFPVQEALESLAPLVKELGPISALFVAASVPIASTIAVATQFGSSLSPSLLLKILQALGLIPVGKPQGLVFNSETDEGVPFAVLTFRSRNAENDLAIIETVVSDSNGIYKGINLPAGSYQIEVSQQDFKFPTTHPRPRHLGMADYYQGEVFSLTGDQEPLFLIPLDPLVSNRQHRWKIKARLVLARLARQSSVALFPLALLSGVLLIVYPTIWNWLIFGLYAVLVGRRVLIWFRVPIITGTVVDEKGNPMPKVIVRLSTIDENALAAVLLTNEKGEFAYFGKPALYQLSLQRPEYVWMTGDTALSFFEVDVRNKREHVVANLTPLAQVYSQMMSS